jgi:hypothetical protein
MEHWPKNIGFDVENALKLKSRLSNFKSNVFRL